MFLVSRQPWGLACSRMATATPTSTPTTRGSGYSNNNYYDDDKNGSIRDAGQSGDRTVGTRARAMAWAAAHEGRLRRLRLYRGGHSRHALRACEVSFKYVRCLAVCLIDPVSDQAVVQHMLPPLEL